MEKKRRKVGIHETKRNIHSSATATNSVTHLVLVNILANEHYWNFPCSFASSGCQHIISDAHAAHVKFNLHPHLLRRLDHILVADNGILANTLH